MADFHITVGYRTVSSWSLRGWLPVKKAGVPFEETLIRYRTPEGRAELDRLSPTGKVPFLVHRRADGSTVKVWDSLAIGEYMAETVPAARLWPEDPVARAHARSIAAEMHSGFVALRKHFDMALFDRRPTPDDPQALKDAAAHPDDLARMPRALGRGRRRAVPVRPLVNRRRGLCAGGDALPHLWPDARRHAAAYMEAVLADPDFRAWEAQAQKDPPLDPPPS